MARFNVKALRESMGKSQPEFADVVGVDERTIRRWEHQDVDPSPMATRRLREIQSAHTGSPETVRPQRKDFTPPPSVEPATSGVGPRRAFLGT